MRAKASISGRAPGKAFSIACSRATTLSTLPSTGVAGRSKAIAAIADRVVHVGSGAIVGDEPNPSPADPMEIRW